MLNPMALPITHYSQADHYPKYQPCYTAGFSSASALTYMQARNLFADRSTPSVTLVGKVFDAVMESGPLQTVFRGLDYVGRYIFGVCDATNIGVTKKRLDPALIVVLISGDGSYNSVSKDTCSSKIAINSLNETVELSLYK